MPVTGRFHGPAGCSRSFRVGVLAGQAGLLARVMTAGAMRVGAPFAAALEKAPGDFETRARCRFRSVTTRNPEMALVRAL